MKKIGLIVLTLVLLLATVACTEEEPTPTESLFADMKVGGTVIAIDAEAVPILAALGQEIAYEESPSCAFEGMDKIYAYSGYRVQTYTKDGKDYIRSVELIDDSLATPEGIAIGAAQADVISAYGTPTKQTDTSIQYENTAQKTVLQFILRNGAVTNIQYLKAEA